MKTSKKPLSKEPVPNTLGRPSKYRTDYSELAYRLCLMGADDSYLAKLFAVSDRTIHYWKKTYPDFREALKNGKAVADAQVAFALYQSAIGGHVIQEEYVSYKNGIAETTTVKKKLPPNVKAQQMWLFNRQPDLWCGNPADKQQAVTPPAVPKAELDAIHLKNLEKQKVLMATVMGRAARLGIVFSDRQDLTD